MAIPLAYNLRNLVVRKTTTIMTALGIALTVAVLLAILSLVSGLRSTLSASGDPLKVLVLRKGSDSELVSNFLRTQYQDLKFKPGIATGRDGQPLASLELVTVVNLASVENPNGMNVTVRGLGATGLEMRPNIHIVSGRWFNPGHNELAVGKLVAQRYPGAKMGQKIHVGRSDWEIVGVFDAVRGAQDSEIWGDLNTLSADMQRVDVLSSALVLARDPVAAAALANDIENDQRLGMHALSEKEYYDLQTASGAPIEFVGIFVSIIMAIGSSFAAMNTMYAAVSRRAREIGTLRVLGFSRGSILFSFFVESVLLSALGGALGCLLVLPLNGLTTGVGTSGFSELAFDFHMTPQIFLIGIAFAVALGSLGGFFPARMASRKEILTALREVCPMDAELKNLKIDRSKRRSDGPSPWATRIIIVGILLFLALGAWRLLSNRLDAAPMVDIQRVQSISAAAAPDGVVLNATGYIVAAHKIEVAAKVIGKVNWIGVEKGDHVKEGQVLVRLEDDEYQAQLQQAKGQLANLQAKLDEAMHGSRPEEIAQALANLDSSKADLDNAKVTLDRARKLVRENLMAAQSVDDAQARYDGAVHKVNSLQKTYDLVKLGPRQEEIDSLRGQVQQARGALAYAETNLANTIIRAPITGTILERAVEKGEFVTTSFVGDRGAKGYVVSLADLNDLEVELDISQGDFARLQSAQRGIITTDAFPDLKYQGHIKEISPEANRQKATVQIKVKVEKPDEHLRPEMNASVAFLADQKPQSAAAPAKPVVIVPASAVHDSAVFVVLDGKAVRRAVKTGATSGQGVRIEDGLIGGEELIVSPPAGLKDGDRVRQKV